MNSKIDNIHNNKTQLKNSTFTCDRLLIYDMIRKKVNDNNTAISVI